MQIGFYVTMKRAERVAWLAGPYGSKEEAESHVREASDKAIKIDPRAHWDAFGVTRVERDGDVPLPLGVLTKAGLI